MVIDFTCIILPSKNTIDELLSHVNRKLVYKIQITYVCPGMTQNEKEELEMYKPCLQDNETTQLFLVSFSFKHIAQREPAKKKRRILR